MTLPLRSAANQVRLLYISKLYTQTALATNTSDGPKACFMSLIFLVWFFSPFFSPSTQIDLPPCYLTIANLIRNRNEIVITKLAVYRCRGGGIHGLAYLLTSWLQELKPLDTFLIKNRKLVPQQKTFVLLPRARTLATILVMVIVT